MKIYGDVKSPFVRMTLVTAHEAGLKDRINLVETGAKMMEVSATLERLSPIGKMPVLETDHHHPIHDSRVIMEYLAHVSGRSDLIPDDGVKRFRVLTLLATAIGAAEAAVALRYEIAQRPEPMRWPQYQERLVRRIGATLDDFEVNWSDALGAVNVGSIAVACALGYIDFRHANLDWRQGRAKLAHFEKDFAARASLLAWSVA